MKKFMYIFESLIGIFSVGLSIKMLSDLGNYENIFEGILYLIIVSYLTWIYIIEYYSNKYKN